MRQIYFILFFFFSGVVTNNLLGQCSMILLNNDEKSQQADAIFEGKVISQFCYTDAVGNVHTLNKVEVSSVVKGTEVPHLLQVHTPGGVTADRAQLYFPGLNLQVGEQGLFYCTEKDGRYFPVALSQGFVPYEAATEKSSAVQISAISPLNVNAGTQDEITITGSDFGNSQGTGTVSFRNADNGGSGWVAIAPGPHYTLWSNNMIKMLIPTYTQNGIKVAGSGNVKVTTAAGETVQSTQQLNIHYALSELVYNGQIGKISLAGVDLNGGYTMQMSSLFAQNEEATRALKKGMTTWRCNTGINISLDTLNYLHAIPAFNDGLSSISFDEQGLLPTGALATTVISVSACSNEGVMNWQLSEVDMIYSSTALWNMGSGQPFTTHFDFESVVLHELGHLHLEQHNNNTNSVMYYRLNSGETKRNLFNDSGLDGGIEVMQNSINPGYSCGNYPHITPLNSGNCSLVGIKDNEWATEEQVSVFPNPSQGVFTINWSEVAKAQVQLSIHNQIGELVFSQSFVNSNSAVIELPFSAGIYMLELRSEENTITRKICIQ
ncbi:MAG: zinc-dependent metalloprotease [Bacteroidia bacterium]